MSGKLFFKIPSDRQGEAAREVMAQLIKSVPSTWRWMSGVLYPAEHLIASGRVEESTGFILQRFHDIRPTIVGECDLVTYQRKQPNLFAIMVEQKLPGFVVFDEAGLDCRTLTFEVAQRIAAGFIRRGYTKGGFRFRSNDFRNCMNDNPARCDMVFVPWQGGWANGEEGPQPARVRVEWDERFGGSEEDVAPIVAACRLSNLREYVSVAPAEVAIP